MQKFVPMEKLSKKEKQRLAKARRGSWNGVCPVTRKVESKKLYHRKRNPFGTAQDGPPSGFCFVVL